MQAGIVWDLEGRKIKYEERSRSGARRDFGGITDIEKLGVLGI